MSPFILSLDSSVKPEQVCTVRGVLLWPQQLCALPLPTAWNINDNSCSANTLLDDHHVHPQKTKKQQNQTCTADKAFSVRASPDSSKTASDADQLSTEPCLFCLPGIFNKILKFSAKHKSCSFLCRACTHNSNVGAYVYVYKCFTGPAPSPSSSHPGVKP